jgi:carbon storage regulator
MLVLSRMKDEEIIIGDEIRVTVVEIRGNKVRLGIQAPRDIPVHRKEVWLSMRGEGNPENSE